MLLCAQYILPVSSEPIIDGAVLVRDGVIRDIGKAEQLRLRYPEEEVVDQGLAAVMPGLVDLHTRLEQSVLRGVVNDAPYVQWLAEVAQNSGRMEASDWFDSAILGGLEALSSGITTVADITLTGASCTAVNKLGLRSVIYRQVGAMDKNRIDAAMQFAQKDILHWREEVDSDRVTIGIVALPSARRRCEARLRGDPALAAHRREPGALRAELERLRRRQRHDRRRGLRGRRGSEETALP